MIRAYQKDRSDSNPALGRRKLKLGTFQTNLDSGCVMSDLDGRLELTWPNTVTLAQLADAMDFEALVPVARWRGFGGATDPQGPGFETFTWAAGIAGATKNSGVISTSHVALNHPIAAAKQSTVIDHISGGRYTLNIVNGWNYPEMEMFGVSLLEHEARYVCAEEWLTIVKRLWTEDETFDFDGKFYRIKGGYLQPKPIQKPHPAIMNAGSSERGRHFACRHCDLVFTNIRSHDLAVNTAHVAAYRTLARETYGREVKVWSNAT
ncbi:MAG: LLM class flavin-dependent oxidoreductase, partial [Xanthobacteraceae bacterium]